MSDDEDVLVALGSNLGDRLSWLRFARRRLSGADTEIRAASPVFETDPVGGPPQGPYLNAALRLTTRCEPEAFLDRLLAIERDAGRFRRELNGPRSLDLDILVFGTRIIDTPRLNVPHPRLCDRAFVLVPASAIAADREIPGGLGTIGAQALRVGSARIVRVAGAEDWS